MKTRDHHIRRCLLPVLAALSLASGITRAQGPGEDAHANPTATYGENPAGAAARRGLDTAEQKRRRDMVRDYLARQRAELDVVATTVTDSGQVIDWVRPGSQVASGRLATPPPLPEEASADEHRGAVPSTGELAQQQHARGPEGTVPVVRRDIDEVINAMSPPGSLRDFLSKSGNAGDTGEVDSIPAPGDAAHMYAYTSQYISNIGASGYINLWNPYVYPVSEAVDTWGEFSLGQVAVANETDTQEEKETIEAGWQDFPALYGDNYPHLFIYYTTTGYTDSGDYIGGYNRDVKGWVQYARSSFPGMRLTHPSTYDGTQTEMRIIVQKYSGNWWIYANGEWMGYYPGSLFRDDGLGDEANKLAWYGEIVDVDDGYATYTDMGSGSHAAAGFGRAAYMRNLRYLEPVRGAGRDYLGTSSVSNEQCYSLKTSHASGTTWGSYQYWGGPGRINRYSTECGMTFVRLTR